MFPRWHILFGGMFALLIWAIVPGINPIFPLLIFLSSFLIDFDHYMCSVFKTKKFGLFHSFNYYRELMKEELKKKAAGFKEKSDFYIFHTIEFHVLIGLLGFFWIGFFYVFIGMVFHSLLDIYSIILEDNLFQREFFLLNWIYKKL